MPKKTQFYYPDDYAAATERAKNSVTKEQVLECAHWAYVKYWHEVEAVANGQVEGLAGVEMAAELLNVCHDVLWNFQQEEWKDAKPNEPTSGTPG